jgi:predicted alpha/beta-fold hydrolase
MFMKACMMSYLQTCTLFLLVGYGNCFLPQFLPKNSENFSLKRVAEAVKQQVKVNVNVNIFEAVNQFTKDKDRRLSDYQKQMKPIVTSFQPQTYNPHPALRNRHLQTILGVYIRDEPGVAYIDEKSNTFESLVPVGKAITKAVSGILDKNFELLYFEQVNTFWDKRERFRTNDGDFFDVDYKFADPTTTNDVSNSSSEGLVVIIHGLESNSNSSLCTNMADAFRENNMDIACINFRGCSGEPNDTLFMYHAGFTGDLLHFMNEMEKRRVCAKKPLYISGFSLGSNVVMKCIGDLGIDAVEKFNIRGAAVSGAPFTLMWHYRQLVDDTFNKAIYAGHLLKSMKTKVEYLTDRFMDGNKDHKVFDYYKCMEAKNINEIEDGMIAPMWGFEDEYDYYRQSAALPVVDQIAVPTFVLNAVDDPFFHKDKFPWEKDASNGGIAPLKLSRTEHGGHLGHLFHVRGVQNNDNDNEDGVPSTSFMPVELARFIDHVHKSNQSKRF